MSLPRAVLPRAVPADVPESERARFLANLHRVTQGSGRLMLMAGDQKVEHLNDDFVGDHVAVDDADPEHLFRIASRARIGAFATQLGLISRYAPDYRDVPYVVKLNAKTHLVPARSADPLSRQWHTIEQVVRLRDTAGLQIVGIGYTLYPGSAFEAEMLAEAAKAVFEAHQQGLLAILWAYPRGQHITDEHDAHLIAGVAGLAACLGADFVKVNAPSAGPQSLREAVRAAGRTGVVCAGGGERGAEAFLRGLHAQLTEGGAAGSATGRNIHQRPLAEAVRLCNAITALDCDGASLDDALRILHGS
ncbi:aldolase [Thiomonas sp.]|jgi:class I fructose-bisphosphate aldolase/fructose-bisphosphate aldolase/6-deoxy-5-ketofructose 1-phosphate synthase|uniref:fructose-bisphosphate aldolase n=1 Tax=Thiomonas intermedia (strain K12) TaxID=75379 RepID=D5X531_THIK1|nr:aldolase [Thiomonas sp.]